VRKEIGALGALGAYINNGLCGGNRAEMRKKGFLRGKTLIVFPLKRRFGYFIVEDKVTRGG